MNSEASITASKQIMVGTGQNKLLLAGTKQRVPAGHTKHVERQQNLTKPPVPSPAYINLTTAGVCAIRELSRKERLVTVQL